MTLQRQLIRCCLLILITNIALADTDVWPYLRKQTFQDRIIESHNDYIKLYAPDLAADASLVPISIQLSAKIIDKLQKLYLIIDRNPDPYAMEIKFYDQFNYMLNTNERTIYTRVRVNNFSDVRAIIETKDNQLYMDTTFVAGSGGCSSPPSTSLTEALTGLGKIKVRLLNDRNINDHWRKALIKIKHPNFTGMQPSGNEEDDFIPARYIHKVMVHYGEEPLMLIRSGITISENPAFRFDFDSRDNKKITIEAVDTENTVFKF